VDRCTICSGGAEKTGKQKNTVHCAKPTYCRNLRAGGAGEGSNEHWSDEVWFWLRRGEDCLVWKNSGCEGGDTN